ncbi:MAG: hypothetical protein R3D27_10205 [Hyphomicrobiaceae bacterium]
MSFLRSTLVPIAAVIAAATLSSHPTSATAAPIPASRAMTGDTSITLVSGGHHTCQRHYVPRWRVVAPHRHVGPRNMPVACGKRWRGRGLPPRHRERGCFKLGPIWYCP